jgi:CBS domain-containing protein
MLKYKVIEIFTSEQAHWKGHAVYKTVVKYVNDLKIAARTIVTKGVEGSYESGDIATEWIEVLSFNMPMRITIILPASELEFVLSGIQEMVTDGIIALRDLDVIIHKTSGYLMPRNTRVREIMTASPKKVSRSTRLNEVAKILLSSTFTGVPVVDEENRPVGVIAQGDLLYKANMPLRLGLLTGSAPSKTDEVLSALWDRKASEIMSQPAVVIDQDQPATVAVDLMLEKNVKRLPVVDTAGKLVGILSRLDVFQTVIRECPDWRAFQTKRVQVENLKLVSDIIRTDTCTVLPDTSVDEVIQMIDRNDIERVCVVDKDGLFLGMISDRNLLIAFVDRHPGIWDYLTSRLPFTEKGQRYRELKEHLQSKTAAEVMKTQVLTIREDAPLEEAIRLMLERVIKRLPVVDEDGRFKGIVSRDSLMRAGFASL